MEETRRDHTICPGCKKEMPLNSIQGVSKYMSHFRTCHNCKDGKLHMEDPDTGKWLYTIQGEYTPPPDMGSITVGLKQEKKPPPSPPCIEPNIMKETDAIPRNNK